jgi:outer membrane protein TolC
MKHALVPIFLVLALCSASSQEQPLSLAGLPELVLSKDPTIDSLVQSSLMAYHAYQGTIAQSWPQLDFSSSYGLQYTPEQTIETGTASVTSSDQAGHSADARLSVSQLLPTAGSLSLVLDDRMTASTLSSRTTTIGGIDTTENPDPQFAQDPVLSLSLTQPLFLNGKILDLDLFPATLRKAQIGYEKADLSRRAQTNQALFQAIQLFLQVVQLRKSVGQTAGSIAVTQGNLDSLQRSFELGSVAESDLLDSKIALENQKAGLIQLRSTLVKAERALAHSIGREALDGVALSDDIPAVDFGLSSDQAVAKAMAGSPLILQQVLASEDAKVSDILAGQRYASTLSLSFSYSPRYPPVVSQPYMTDFGHSFADLYADGSGSDFSLSASLNIPIFDGGQAGEARGQNAAAIRLAQQSLASQKQALQDQVENDLLQKSSLESRISLLTESLRLSKMRLDTEVSLKALGRSTDLSVDSRRADYEAKENDLWRARADLLLTVLDLTSLTGGDISEIFTSMEDSAQ